MPETLDPVAPRSPARRTIVKGAAWAVPAVTLASAAPAMAASPDIVHGHVTTWRWYSNSFPGCGSNRDGLEINTTEGGYTRFTDTRSWTTITNVYALFWFSKADITWTATGNSSCWSAPSYDNTSVTLGSRTYYRYRSEYGCPITPTHLGTTVLQPYRWRSQCFNENDFEYMRWVRRQAFATVNGVVQPLDTGYFLIDSTP